jgi:hypothetical protein
VDIDTFILNKNIEKLKKSRSIFAKYFSDIVELKRNNMTLDDILEFLRSKHGSVSNDEIKEASGRFLGGSKSQTNINNVSKVSLFKFIDKHKDLIIYEINRLNREVFFESQNKEKNMMSTEKKEIVSSDKFSTPLEQTENLNNKVEKNHEEIIAKEELEINKDVSNSKNKDIVQNFLLGNIENKNDDFIEEKKSKSKSLKDLID